MNNKHAKTLAAIAFRTLKPCWPLWVALSRKALARACVSISRSRRIHWARRATWPSCATGHSARIEFDARDDIFVGHLLGIDDRVSFHADTVAGLKAAFEEAVNHYLLSCQQTGRTPQSAASGRLMLRIAPQVHRASLLAAQAAGKA